MARRSGRQEPTPEPPRRGGYLGGGVRWIALAVVALVVALIIAILAMNTDEEGPEPERTLTPEATSSRWLPSDASPQLLHGWPAV